MYYPTEKEFIKLAKKGNLIPVYKELITDLETPVSAFMKIQSQYSFLLESVEGGEKTARYSFLGSCRKKDVYNFKSFDEIRQKLKTFKPVKVQGLPRFHGGVVGFVSYDKVREIEAIPDTNPDDLKLPGMVFLLTDTLLAFDHLKKKILIISNAQVGNDPKGAYQQACRKIDQLERKLKKNLKLKKEEFSIPKKPLKKLKIKSNFSQTQFEQAVKKAKKYIRAGDIIQVVPSQRFSAEYKGDPLRVYRILRLINPSPYMYYLKLGKLQIVGTSPEVMVRLEDGLATVRPIAGTKKRGKDQKEDQKQEAALLNSKKEIAEHVMLVDLGRNDLGRVCNYGSVKVTEEMKVERYSHVMHIVSNVVGRLKKKKDAIDLLLATFPAGTVTGAPKIRAMEIIDELEPQKRGIYAGCVSYFGFTGEFDSCITIRTILFDNNQAYVQAGAGIVADSIPKSEYQETVNKAKAMFRAIELAR